MTRTKSIYIDLSNAPWTMHEFFAGSGLVGYGLQGMFAPIWANDISEQKAAVYTANFGKEPASVTLKSQAARILLSTRPDGNVQIDTTSAPKLTLDSCEAVVIEL